MYNTFGITPSKLTYKTYQNLLLDIKNNLYKYIEAFRNGDFKSAIDIFNSGIVAVILININ